MTGDGKVALVTGGAVRLGRGIVEELARSGWSVAFSYRTSRDSAQRLADELSGVGAVVAAFAADLDDPGQRRRLLDDVAARFGGLDALVNSAAVFPRTPLAELDEQALAATLRTNLEAPLFLTLAAVPLLRARSGTVVNIADVYAFHALKHYLAYAVSKAALVAATRGLAVELAPEIRVNAIAPGIALFPEHYDEETRARLLRRTPLQREAGAAEIGRAVRYLIEDARTVTGQVLVIDGGQTVVLG